MHICQRSLHDSRSTPPILHDKARVEQHRHRDGAGGELVTDKGGRAATDHTKDHASTHGDDAGQRAVQRRPTSSCHNDLHCHSTRQRMKRCLHKQLSKSMTLAFVDALEPQRRSHSAALAAMQGVPRFSRTGHAMDGSRDKGSLVRPRKLPTILTTPCTHKGVALQKSAI